MKKGSQTWKLKWNSFKNSFSIKKLGSRVLYAIGKLFSVVSLLVVLLVSILTVASCFAYFQLANNHVSCTFFFEVLNIGGFLFEGPVTLKFINDNIELFKVPVEYATNTTVAISGLLLTVITAYSYFSKVSNFRKQSSFKKFRVYKSGVDDINVMKKYFKGADKIIIFSSTFSWATKEGIVEELETAGKGTKKLWLYSDDPETAKENLKEKDTLNKQLYENDGRPIHFSFVERDTARYILYRQEQNEETNVILFSDKEESKGLFDIIDALVTQLT